MSGTSATDQVNRLLKALCPDGSAAVKLDPDGVCSVTIDEKLECNFELDGELLVMFCPLVRPPNAGLTDFMASLLRANLFGLDTEGGHLGLCDQSGYIVFSHTIDVTGLNEADFLEGFENFVRLALEFEEAYSRPALAGPATMKPAVDTMAMRV